MNRQRGFTLLELLVAIAIFAVMSVLAYGGLRTVLDGRTQAEQSAERLNQLQSAFQRVARDFEQLSERPVRDEFGDSLPALRAEVGGAQLVEFTRGGWSNPTFANRSTLQRVAYLLDGEGRWQRRWWRVLDRTAGSVPADDVLLDKVRQIDLRYLDEAGEWQTSWPPLGADGAPSAALPRAVEISVDVEELGRITRLLRLPRGSV